MRLIFFFCLIFTFNTFSQEDILAKEYYKNGEFEKALATYKRLHKKTPNNNAFLVALVKTHQQLEQLDEAETLLLDQVSRITYPALYVELGYNYQLKNNLETANINYKKAIAYIDGNPNYAYTVGKYFEDRSLLDEATITYEKAMVLKPTLNFNSQLARIYGEQGNIEKMFESYINFVALNRSYLNTIKRAFNDFISENSENENNIMLKRILLKKIQQKPDLLWNELLSWLFIQQKDYKKAFTQEKAIFKREQESMQNIIDLGVIARDQNDNEAALLIFNYLAENAQNSGLVIESHKNIIEIETKSASKKEYKNIAQKYNTLLQEYGKHEGTLSLQLSYAHFLAFYLKDTQNATEFLKESLKSPLRDFSTAQIKLELGDILVLQEKFNEALIYYTQIQRSLKNSTLAQEARYKVAQTSYFKGDFNWAESQLKILKSSTSQLIANDALDLMLLITDNKFEDSLQTALKLYAKADLMAFQNKPNEAITILDSILLNHKGESIEDQALYKQGKLFESLDQYEKAVANYNAIITNYKDDILADDAYFALAELYEYQLQQPQKAKEFYEKILFNHEDSIYFIEARKKFRMLRGDSLN